MEELSARLGRWRVRAHRCEGDAISHLRLESRGGDHFLLPNLADEPLLGRLSHLVLWDGARIPDTVRLDSWVATGLPRSLETLSLGLPQTKVHLQDGAWLEPLPALRSLDLWLGQTVLEPVSPWWGRLHRLAVADEVGEDPDRPVWHSCVTEPFMSRMHERLEHLRGRRDEATWYRWLDGPLRNLRALTMKRPGEDTLLALSEQHPGFPRPRHLGFRAWAPLERMLQLGLPPTVHTLDVKLAVSSPGGARDFAAYKRQLRHLDRIVTCAGPTYGCLAGLRMDTPSECFGLHDWRDFEAPRLSRWRSLRIALRLQRY